MGQSPSRDAANRSTGHILTNNKNLDVRSGLVSSLKEERIE
jgi:hypothetical protein